MATTGGHSWRLGLVLCPVLACAGCDIYFFVCDPAPAQALSAMPERLSETGLFSGAPDDFAPGVSLYQPEFQLWSDGAEKRRWILLPDNSQIDASDMDSWQFPIGTKIWKEFAVSGRPIETRFLLRISDDDGGWAGQSYLWQDAEQDALAVPEGAIDARGEAYQVPAASECAGCHGGRKSYVLGFSGIQLSAASPPGGINLASLVAADLISPAPNGELVVPGNDVERGALGYLHANCGHCHNSDRPERRGERCFEPQNSLDFWLTVDALGAPEETATYRSAVGNRAKPGNPDGSELIDRISRRDFIYQMPPLGTDRVDAAALSLLRQWIAELQ